jgi:hypothetical protein
MKSFGKTWKQKRHSCHLIFQYRYGLQYKLESKILISVEPHINFL